MPHAFQLLTFLLNALDTRPVRLQSAAGSHCGVEFMLSVPRIMFCPHRQPCQRPVARTEGPVVLGYSTYASTQMYGRDVYGKGLTLVRNSSSSCSTGSCSASQRMSSVQICSPGDCACFAQRQSFLVSDQCFGVIRCKRGTLGLTPASPAESADS